MGVPAVPRDNADTLPAILSELLDSRHIRDCLSWFQREKKWINERHLEICRIPSPTFFEAKRAEWAAEAFRTAGWEAQIDRSGNVLAFSDGARQTPSIAVTAHLDTVLAPRTPEDVYVSPDGSFHGPGVSDNGAGLAALFAIAAAWKSCLKPDAGPSVVLIANVGEEGEGNLSGMRYLCNQSPVGRKIRTFMVLDGPNTDHITCQALASRRFDVALTGPGGHSWSDYGIGNPVHALSRAITLFNDEAGSAQGPRYSYNFGLMQGGSSINSIPASARAKVDIRSENAARIAELATLLSDCVERAVEIENQRSIGGKISARLKEIGARPGGQLPEDASLLSAIRAVDSHLGIKAHLDCASTDANVPLSLGLPAISIGAGGQGGGAHTLSEWFHPEGREFGLQRILLTICLLRSEAFQSTGARG
jgi:acetylornithine deacetylase/succinyl-diaminopimelate desuccinylase-like protein